MKKIILGLVLLVSINMFSQIEKIKNPEKIEIGKITPGGIKTIYAEKWNNEYYMFFYKDAKFTQLNEWKSFKINNETDFESLFTEIIKGFSDMPKEDVMLKFPEGIIWLKYEKFLGTKIIRLSQSDERSGVIGFSNQYTEKQINKLFGKNK